MKKIFIVFIGLLCSLYFLSTTQVTNKIYGKTLEILSGESKNLLPTSRLYIHYYRFQEDYSDGWNLWIWQKAPKDSEGKQYDFEKDGNTILIDDYGALAIIDLTNDSLKGATKVGIIMRKGNWESRDINFDRYIEISETSQDGIIHAYLVEDDALIGNSLDDPNGPKKQDKIKYAYFSNEKTITFGLTKQLTNSDIKLFIGDTEDKSCLISVNKNKGTVTIKDNLDFSNDYILQANFSDNIMTYKVTYDGIYDSKAFNDSFYYDKDDLGSYVKTSSTSFRLWAPISSKVSLNLYKTGTPSTLGGSDEIYKSVELTKDVKGTWTTTINENLHGYYYTYLVTNGSNTYEVVDPYAKSAGVNGLRGMVVDFSKVNPSGFKYGSFANNIKSSVDAIIYELHVRDLTSHSSWNGPEEHRGKFLGLTDSGTSYKGVTTGLDHIKELGVTHVQLIPIFDFGAVDETKLNDPKYIQNGIFNWGYMPKNYNVIEGSYSTDPYDGLKRISELKTTTQTLIDNNINVIMDVVYNHTGESADSNLNLIVPGYYYRMNNDGTFSNGSGCGNETASERAMMRKFMIESVTFWAKEYNIMGFRFDLMALHDTTTMNMIVEELHKINPLIMVYGEPWNGGTTLINGSIASDKQNLKDMPYVGAFNDDVRDGIKGSVFDSSGKGYIQGDVKDDTINRVKYGIVGGVNHPGLTTSGLSYNRTWHNEPYKNINYVSAHDNNTLYDKIVSSTSSKQKELRLEMQKQANAIVMTSQGIVFMHAGAEFLRSKPAENGGFDSNSYQSSDKTNQLRWDKKANNDNLACFNYYKQLIAFRKNHPLLRLRNSSEILDNITFLNTSNGIIAYTIDSNNVQINDKYKKILVIHNNASSQIASIKLPSGEWNLVGNNLKIGEDVIRTYLDGESASIFANETLILYQGLNETPKKKKGCKKNALNITLLSISLLASSLLILKKKH